MTQQKQNGKLIAIITMIDPYITSRKRLIRMCSNRNRQNRRIFHPYLAKVI